jgi:uncharacterized membrane protein (Fun14 family)
LRVSPPESPHFVRQAKVDVTTRIGSEIDAGKAVGFAVGFAAQIASKVALKLTLRTTP